MKPEWQRMRKKKHPSGTDPLDFSKWWFPWSQPVGLQDYIKHLDRMAKLEEKRKRKR